MVRVLIILSIIIGGFAVAKDGNVQAPKATIDKDQEFLNSQQGQDVQRLFEEFRSGKKTFDQAYEEFNQKWADKPTEDTPAQVPNAPLLRVR